MSEETVAIIGANLAGGRAAEALRREGFGGSIILVGEEPWRPYERPPLSKDLLWEARQQRDPPFLNDERFYTENGIELCLGCRATELDLASRRIVLSDGRRLFADKVLLCTGGRPRPLKAEGAQLGGVLYMRTLADARALEERLGPGTRVVIIGMGIIGAEVAASARKRDCEVTVVEPATAPMLRLLGNHYGSWLAEKHRRNEVRVLLNTSVQRLVGGGGEVRGVVTGDGRVLPAEVVVVGIGIEPAIELPQAAGLQVGNGVVVDRQCRTSSSGVWAAGDVACQQDFFDSEGFVRLETFQNAQDQGAAAAASMVGKAVDYVTPGWFWTDQYDLNIQLCGRIGDGAQRVVRGSEVAEKFSAFFLRGGVVEGVMTVNRPGDMGIGKRLVANRIAAEEGLLADESVPLRSLLAPKRQGMDLQRVGQ